MWKFFKTGETDLFKFESLVKDQNNRIFYNFFLFKLKINLLKKI
jgi:hypothetical protein